MPTALSRVLQVRAVERVRSGLARHEPSGLPAISALSEADQHALCEVGGGRLAAVVVRLRPGLEPDLSARCLGQDLQALTLREVARVVLTHVRRTDLLGYLAHDTLVVLAPGLDEVTGQSLADRLLVLLARRRFRLGGLHLKLHVEIGAAFRSAASPSGWTARALAAEAEFHAA